MPRKLIEKAQLTERWELFCDEFLVDLNAKNAALRAGYSEKGAKVRGFELLRDKQVQERLARLMAERSKRTEISQQQVVEELRDQLSVTVPDLAFWTNDTFHLKEHSDLTPAERKAVKKLKVKKTVRERYDKDGDLTNSTITFDYEVELHDRIRVVELVGKHIGMWKETHVHVHTPGDYQGVSDEKLEQRLKEIRALRVTTTKAPKPS